MAAPANLRNPQSGRNADAALAFLLIISQPLACIVQGHAGQHKVQVPLNRGWRFCANAAMPSAKSPEPAISC